MTTLAIDTLGPPRSEHERRVVAWTGARAADGLAGRTVWCASAAPARRGDLVAWLDDALEDVRSTMLDVQAGEPLQRLAGRLGAMLSGPPGTPATLGPADDDLCADALADADALLDPVVASGDVVVLCDALAALLTCAIRERGAHAVWFGTGAPVAGQAWGFLRRHSGPADAYVLAGRTRTAGMLAVIPAADLVTAKAGDRGTLTWSSVLADVLERDRDEHVGGLLHARPQVAAR